MNESGALSNFGLLSGAGPYSVAALRNSRAVAALGWLTLVVMVMVVTALGLVFAL
jgi:hypothetical protein